MTIAKDAKNIIVSAMDRVAALMLVEEFSPL